MKNYGWISEAHFTLIVPKWQCTDAWGEVPQEFLELGSIFLEIMIARVTWKQTFLILIWPLWLLMA